MPWLTHWASLLAFNTLFFLKTLFPLDLSSLLFFLPWQYLILPLVCVFGRLVGEGCGGLLMIGSSSPTYYPFKLTAFPRFHFFILFYSTSQFLLSLSTLTLPFWWNLALLKACRNGAQIALSFYRVGLDERSSPQQVKEGFYFCNLGQRTLMLSHSYFRRLVLTKCVLGRSLKCGTHHKNICVPFPTLFSSSLLISHYNSVQLSWYHLRRASVSSLLGWVAYLCTLRYRSLFLRFLHLFIIIPCV